MMIDDQWIGLGYLLSATLFILGLKRLSHPRTAPRGNQLGALGMLVAVLTTVLQMELGDGIEGWILIGSGLLLGGLIGWVMAVRVEMTGMPEMVALFNGFGGAASALVALSESWKYIEDDTLEIPTGLELEVMVVAAGLSALVGWMTLTGSLLAMLKLKGGIEIFGKWIRTPTWGPSWLNPVKGLLFISTLVLIYMSIQEPTETDYLFAIIGIWVPGWPTVSWAVPAAFLFSLSNEKLFRWSLTNKYFGASMFEYYATGKTLPKHVKYIIAVFIFLMSSFSAYFVWLVSTKGNGTLTDPSSWDGADPGFGSATIIVVGFIGVLYVLSQVKSR